MFSTLIVHIRSIIKSFMIPGCYHHHLFFLLFSFLKIGYLLQGTSLDFNKGLVKSKFTFSTDISPQLSEGNCNHRDKQRVLPAGSVSGRRMLEPDLVNYIMELGMMAEKRRKRTKNKPKTKETRRKTHGTLKYTNHFSSCPDKNLQYQGASGEPKRSVLTGRYE